MDILINIGFAWMAMILGALLSIIYVLRIVNKKIYNNKNEFLSSLGKTLRKPHKTFGILIVITGLIHGLYSSFDVISFNLGTLTWIITILLGLNWMFRKKFKCLGKYWMVYHRGLTSAFIIVLVVHIVTVGGFVGVEYVAQNVLGDFKGQYVSARENEESLVDMEDIEANNNKGKEYIDGIYYGEADGYRPGLQVAVTVENGLIANIEVVNHNEHKERFYGPPIEQIPYAIVEAQSIDVDSVSGSTYTSVGIKNAVDIALKQAIKTNNSVNDKVVFENDEENIIENEKKDLESISIKYKDGAYYGEAEGYRSGLVVEVKIENNLIVSVDVIKHNEHKRRFYGPPMEQIPVAIVEAQSTDVDSVSGSTYTSIGIKNAVDKALKAAMID